ncbi:MULTISPECIES: hypothetical protein [Microvirga]|uniref:hypothetical protein n=1 Tax=Microvirga TaxID=186650 RepID=UPI001CFF7B40|nr:hypothetical protein [Microvirga lenta]MCB5175404.1 hypothetical protein [Microvirga lenta]
MRAEDQPARAAAGRSGLEIDFQVSRSTETLWTIEPVSQKAKLIAAAEFGLAETSPQKPGLVAGHVRSNALLHALRSRGFSILYNGPAGPITL